MKVGDLNYLPPDLRLKVGDLVQFTRHLGVIILANDDATLIRWFDDGSIESVENYRYLSLKVISASR